MGEKKEGIREKSSQKHREGLNKSNCNTEGFSHFRRKREKKAYVFVCVVNKIPCYRREVNFLAKQTNKQTKKYILFSKFVRKVISFTNPKLFVSVV